MENQEHQYSAEINEIVGQPPKWLLKSGGSSLLLLLLILLALSAFTSYSDKHVIPVIIFREKTIFPITGNMSVIRFLKASGEQVKKGDPIALTKQNNNSQMINAPFTGKIFYDRDALKNRHPADTLAMLVPSNGVFGFKGDVGLDYARFLSIHKGTVFTIIPDDQIENNRNIIGKITSFGLPKANNILGFSGIIEPQSGKSLEETYLSILTIKGKLVLNLDDKTILRHIFN
ncbi:hypothetical protein [Pedobacter sp. L105]|uniref:hypothetical protein n=1 Tax=Pedobacter sp. L105 TaxID=1641871 RepID=UPI00131BD920|nr:hypothetical protein [Pedobacter sp. L105]